MREKLRELLSPHFGHLDFLMKIHREEISYEDMSLLVDLIRDKTLTQYLHKDIHSYKSYYILMVELHFIRDNLKYIKFFKELTKIPRDIFLNILNDRSKFNNVRSKIDEIIDSDELTSSFRRWSSRIDSESYALTYVNSIKNKDTLDEIFNSKESVLELKDYDECISYLPSSWCITNRSTFDRYKSSQRMFLIKLNGKIYGVNVNNSYLTGVSFSTRINSMYDSNNSSVYDPLILRAVSDIIEKSVLNEDIIVNRKVDANFGKINKTDSTVKIRIPLSDFKQSTWERIFNYIKHLPSFIRNRF